jgi:hypothetical protein
MNGIPLAVTAWSRVLSSRTQAQLMSRMLICSMTATLAGAGRRGNRVIGRHRSERARSARSGLDERHQLSGERIGAALVDQMAHVDRREPAVAEPAGQLGDVLLRYEAV